MKQRRLFEILETRQLLAAGGVLISEFMASNRDTILDGFGQSSDWIEVLNDSSATVDLRGWSLTDDPGQPGKWRFPSETVLSPAERILVWASGEDTTDGQGEFHTNFKLDNEGEYLGLSNGQGQLVASFGSASLDYPPQERDVSYGLNEDCERQYFPQPSPREANFQGVVDTVADTKFSTNRGLFAEPFSLEISSATPGATLVYTTDGSPPSPRHGVQVSGGDDAPVATLPIDATTMVRAMAFREGWAATNVDTHTYLFWQQVREQHGNGLPNTWGHVGADYEMDPEIVHDPRYRDDVILGLESLPSLSLVTELDHWFGLEGRGIYPSGQGSPRPVSVELLLTDGQEAFQVDGSVEIQGGSSTNRWKSDKLSMRLKFKKDFGDARLEYPLFGEDAATEFDTLIVDAGLNHVWHYGGNYEPQSQRNRAQYTRDQFVADLQNLLGGNAPHGQWVHVYLNGIYWGIYNLHERPDEHFAAAYYGGSEDDYDVIKHNTQVVNGGFANYRALLEAVNADVRQPARYDAVTERLDVDDFISYMLLNYYVGNIDWAHHNWYASFNKNSPQGRWRFHSWDAEHVLKDLRHDVTDHDDEYGPTHIHQRLMRNETYRLKFMDAVQAHLFNDGLLTPARAMQVYQQRLDAVSAALVPESARWGDNRRSDPYRRDVEWAAERDRLLQQYFPARTRVVIEQLRNRGFFHQVDAPRFNQHGGTVPPGFALSIHSTGNLFYTLDGSDPRTSSTRRSYGEPFRIDAGVTVRARAEHADGWSALTEATFDVGRVGDFSQDGVLDAADLDLLFAAVANSAPQREFDLNVDRRVDQLDVDYWVEELAETRRGDINLDRQVNFGDFLTLSANFGKGNLGWEEGDVTGDGFANFEDFLLLSAVFGFSAAAPAAAGG